MGQGKGSANQVMVLGIAILCVLALAQPTLAAVYSVGGSSGWTYNVVSWPNGRTFKAGDALIFKYNKALHNVVAVGRSGYNRCTIPRGAKVRRTGQDIFRLRKGVNYFICSVPGHCIAGMKIAVKAF